MSELQEKLNRLNIEYNKLQSEFMSLNKNKRILFKQIEITKCQLQEEQDGRARKDMSSMSDM